MAFRNALRGEQDWIFASGRMKGRQPLWPEALLHVLPRRHPWRCIQQYLQSRRYDCKCLRELAELNKERNLQRAREADSR
jgi:hypothetical protein